MSLLEAEVRDMLLYYYIQRDFKGCNVRQTTFNSYADEVIERNCEVELAVLHLAKQLVKARKSPSMASEANIMANAIFEHLRQETELGGDELLGYTQGLFGITVSEAMSLIGGLMTARKIWCPKMGVFRVSDHEILE